MTTVRCKTCVLYSVTCCTVQAMPLFSSRALAACPAHRSTSQTPPIQQAASEIKVQMVNGQPSYTSWLQQIRALLTQENVPSADEVQALLGHGVLAGLPVHMHNTFEFNEVSNEKAYFIQRNCIGQLLHSGSSLCCLETSEDMCLSHGFNAQTE